MAKEAMPAAGGFEQGKRLQLRALSPHTHLPPHTPLPAHTPLSPHTPLPPQVPEWLRCMKQLRHARPHWKVFRKWMSMHGCRNHSGCDHSTGACLNASWTRMAAKATCRGGGRGGAGVSGAGSRVVGWGLVAAPQKTPAGGLAGAADVWPPGSVHAGIDAVGCSSQPWQPVRRTPQAVRCSEPRVQGGGKGGGQSPWPRGR